jgi:hypothetical protein
MLNLNTIYGRIGDGNTNDPPIRNYTMDKLIR